MNVLIVFLILVGVLAVIVAPKRVVRLRRVILEHLIVITRCALPIGAGLRALADERLAAGSSGDRKAADVIRGVASRYEASGSLTSAFAEGGSLLRDGQLDLLQTAEQHGALPLALEVLCEEEAYATEGRWRLVEWLAYPLLVAVFILPVGLFQSQVILPKFEEIQEHMGLEPATAAVDISTTLLLCAFALAGLGLFFVRRGVPDRVARFLEASCDLALPKAPFRQRRHGRWLQRAGALLRSGATLPEALDGAGGLRDVGGAGLGRAAAQAREGQPLEVVLRTALGSDAKRFLSQVLMSTERSASLGVGLEASGKRLEKRGNQGIETVVEMLKPLPIVFCGFVAATHVHAVWNGIVMLQTEMVRSVM